MPYALGLELCPILEEANHLFGFPKIIRWSINNNPVIFAASDPVQPLHKCPVPDIPLIVVHEGVHALALLPLNLSYLAQGLREIAHAT